MKSAFFILALLAGVNAAAVPAPEEKVRLIEFSPEEEPQWLSPDEIFEARLAGKRFMDITEDYNNPNLVKFAARAEPDPYPSAGAKDDVVRPLIDKLSVTYMEESLDGLTQWAPRNYNTTKGRDSAIWLRDRIQAFNYGEVTTFEHPKWIQPTIIARVPHNGDADAPVVILGSHTDSVQGQGADDNGSGVVTTLDVLRVLKEAGYATTTNALEFHFYSAEEQGLRGSREVATKYQAEERKVRGMLMADMTAWVSAKLGPRIAAIKDYTDPTLTKFVTDLAKHYATNVNITSEYCGSACSDHGSWYNRNYPAAHIWEGSGNYKLHTTGDTKQQPGWSWDLCREFAKVWLSFAIELTSESPSA